MKRTLKTVAASAVWLSTTLVSAGCVTPAPLEGNAGNETPNQPSPGGTPADEQPRLLTTLFVIGPNMGFVGFDNAKTLTGSSVAVTTDLMLNQDSVSQPRDAALDKRGALYLISGANGGSIAVYDNPMSASGSRKPDRMVFGKATEISRSPTGIAIDHENDLLYLSNAVTDTLVFDISQPEKFTGNVAPVRTFDVDMSLFRAEQLRFANGSLYIADTRGGTSDILVFDNPGALKGKVNPDRVITYTGFDNKIGIDVDAKDRLLVGVRELGQVLIFNNASTLDGAVTPNVALSIGGAAVSPEPSFATTDSEDRLYVADSNGNVVFSFDLTSELVSGEKFADRTINSNELIVPNRLLLFERVVP